MPDYPCLVGAIICVLLCFAAICEFLLNSIRSYRHVLFEYRDQYALLDSQWNSRCICKEDYKSKREALDKSLIRFIKSRPHADFLYPS